VHRLHLHAFYAFFKLLDVVVGNRVSAEVELAGLDVPEVGVLGYPDFVLTPGPEGAGAAGKIATVPHPVLQPITGKS
jgi:ammonium transporter, Amt family